MVKQKTRFVCQQCGAESPKWLGRCNGCGEWNTLVEEKETVVKTAGVVIPGGSNVRERPKRISEIAGVQEQRINTGSVELDRVLGGGIVPGSLILVGGDPGIGKSTLLLQTSHALAGNRLRVLYVTGEESRGKSRCARNGSAPRRRLCLCCARRIRITLSQHWTKFGRIF